MHGRLTGPAAVVTGAARATGRAWASRRAAEGASVADLDIADGSGTKGQVGAAGSREVALLADVADADQGTATGDLAEAAPGAPGVLVSDAGSNPSQRLAESGWSATAASGHAGLPGWRAGS